MIHELKIYPEHFSRVKDGTKTFEIRSIKDRMFQRGDRVKLNKFDPVKNEYMASLEGSSITKTIGDVYFIPGTELCVFSLLEARE